METIIKELLKFSNQVLEFNKPVEASFIIEFETKYNLTLPNDCKFLLGKTNGFSLMGSGVLGLHGEKITDSLEMVYKFEHYEVFNPQPTYLIPFCNDGRGNFIALILEGNQMTRTHIRLFFSNLILIIPILNQRLLTKTYQIGLKRL